MQQSIEQTSGVLVSATDLEEITGLQWLYLEDPEVRHLYAGFGSTVGFLSKESPKWVIAYNPQLGQPDEPWILLNSNEDTIYGYASSFLSLILTPRNLGLLRGEIATFSMERRNSWRHPRRAVPSWRNLWGILS